jgi:hypothetical protein
MIGRRLAFCAFVLMSPVLSACGKNPTDNLEFKAPPGWTSTPSMFGAKVWIKNEKSKNEIVFLLDLPGKADAKLNTDISKEIGSKGYSGGNVGVVEKRSHIKICGDHAAEFLQARADKNGQRSQTEIVLTNWNKDLYVALYSRAANAPADPAGEAAIRSVCLKR